MKVLLDTSTFLWMSTDETMLSSPARRIIADPSNTRFSSSISVVELAIKTRLEKLTLHAPLDQAIREGVLRGAVEELPLRFEHSLALAGLPLLHRDPFDRILIAQAQVERIALITSDALIRQYPVQTIW